VEISKTDRSKRRTTVILQIPPQTDPIVFEVQGWEYSDIGGTAEEKREHTRYYYEEHTCPTNWFRDVKKISIGDDDDPHGLVVFVEQRRGS
jgi:hypothetical protein